MQAEIAALLVFAAAVALPLAAICWPRVHRSSSPDFLQSGAVSPCASDAIRWPALNVSPQAAELTHMDAADKEYLMGLVLRTLGGPPADEPEAEQRPAPALCVAELDTALFVTLYGPGGARLRAMANEKNLAQSALKAAEELSKDPSLEEYGFGSGRNVRARIDILTRARPLSQEQKMWLGLAEFGSPAGIALATENGLEFFLPADAADFGAATYHDMMRYVCRKAAMPGELWRTTGCLLYYVEAVSFVNEARGATRCLDTPRGLVLLEDVSPSGSLRSCEGAADYLVRVQRQDGSFAVAQEAASGAFIGSGSLNQDAAITYVLARSCALNGKERYRKACLKSLARIYTAVHALRGERGMAVIMEESEPQKVARLSTAALALCALCEFRKASQDEAFDDLIARLAGFLLFMQNEDGGFELRYNVESEKRHSDNCTPAQRFGESAQAALGLVLAFRELKEPRLLLSAGKAIERLTATESEGTKGGFRAPRGHLWLVLAIRELLPLAWIDRYGAYADNIAGAAAWMQMRADDAPPDLAGSATDGYPPALGRTARNLELLTAVLGIEQSANAPSDEIQSAALGAARYVMQMQVTPENSYLLPGSDAALGGFLERYGSKLIITDSVAHALNGLAELAQIAMSRNLTSDTEP